MENPGECAGNGIMAMFNKVLSERNHSFLLFQVIQRGRENEETVEHRCGGYRKVEFKSN